jgi:hypothetical protein
VKHDPQYVDHVARRRLDHQGFFKLVREREKELREEQHTAEMTMVFAVVLSGLHRVLAIYPTRTAATRSPEYQHTRGTEIQPVLYHGELK